jgi:DNA-binding beta-propeller fold protein YncE
VDDSLYVTNGGWVGAASEEELPNTAAVLKIADGQATEVAQIWPLEKEQNPDGHILESHPYGQTLESDGKLYVADAGANTVLAVDPSVGQVDLVATLGGIPSPLPNPARGDAMESDPVPTAVAFGQDGNMYV